jgi:hypothetical protein
MDYSDCVLFHCDNCDKFDYNKNVDLCSFKNLTLDISDHCKKLKTTVPNLSEADLVRNRLGQDYSDDDQICPYHRFTNGIFWNPPKRCQHPGHNTICDKCRKKTSSPAQPTESDLDHDYKPPRQQVVKNLLQSDVQPTNLGTTNQLSPCEVSKSGMTVAFDSHRVMESGIEEQNELRERCCNDVKIESLEAAEDDVKQLYDATADKKQRILLMSTIAKRLSIRQLMERFSCSRRMAASAIEISCGNPKKLEDLAADASIRRHKMDMEKAEHFMDFLFTAGFLQDVAFGTTSIITEKGAKITIPFVVRTIVRAHIISAYKSFCDTILYEPLSDTSLWRIINVCKASQRKAMQCLDNYIAEGEKGFAELETFVNTSDITSDMKLHVIILKHKYEVIHYLNFF